MNKFHYIITILFFSFISCSEEQFVVTNKYSIEGTNNSTLSRSIKTEKLTKEDSLFLLQSDPINIIVNRIEYKENKYFLDLGEEDIKELGIPDSIYYLALGIVESYNNVK